MLTLCNAALGFLREVLVAKSVGAGTLADSFFTAFSLVQTVNDLVFGSLIFATVVPVLAALPNKRQGGAAFARALSMAVAILALVLATVLFLGRADILALFVPGLDDDGKAQAIAFMGHLAWLLPPLALNLVLSQVLNAHGRFLAAATAMVLPNLSFVLVLAVGGGDAASLLQRAAMLGPVAAMGLLAVAVLRGRFMASEPWRLAVPPARMAGRLGLPVLLSLGIGNSLSLLMLSHILLRMVGSFADEGSVAALAYAFRIYELPLTLVAYTAGMLIFPALASLHGDNDKPRIALLMRQLLIWGSLIFLPIASVVALEAHALVSLLLERGSFDHHATRRTAEALAAFAPVIPLEAMLVVLYRLFYAIHRPKVPVLASAIAIATLVLLLALYRILPVFPLPLTLSGAFLAADGVLILTLIRLGRGILPPWRLLAGLGAAEACAWTGWRLLRPDLAVEWMSGLVGAVVFCCIFAATALSLLPEQRRQLAGLTRRRL